jgi:beta-lactamase superfamily II metal-dependent hydrolase
MASSYRPVRVIQCLLMGAVLLLLSTAAFADIVIPSPDVTVVVRASASAQSAQVGTLRPGDQALLLGSVPSWYRIRLGDGTQGFVSKRWTQLVADPPPPGATFTVDVVDVGTGLGILVRGPDFTLIYDGGSNDDLARGAGNRMLAYIKAVVPTLTTIDEMILSHPQSGPCGAAAGPLRRLQGARGLGFGPSQ